MSIANRIVAILHDLTLSSIISLAVTILIAGGIITLLVKYPWYLALSLISLLGFYLLTRKDFANPPELEDDERE